jgi:cobalt/nickel transport protein
VTAPAPARRDRRFLAAFLLVTLLIAGALSYLASSSPDGLDSATLRGCEVSELNGEEVLTGDCIARSAQDHPLAASPLADYSIVGSAGTVGVAGVLGVLVSLAVAAGLFRVLARRSPRGPGAR